MIKPENVPTCVAEKLRRMVYDFETNEYVLIAAALNAWPGVRMMVDIDTGDDAAIKLPLPQETRDDQ